VIFCSSLINYKKYFNKRLTPLSGVVFGVVLFLIVAAVLGVVLGLIPVYLSDDDTKTEVFNVTEPTTTTTTPATTTTPQGIVTSNKIIIVLGILEAILKKTILK
jgi:hypothetical protein